MTCPACSTELTADDLPVDGRIGVCPKCARSVVLVSEAGDFGTVLALRIATSADLEHLDDGQIKALRKARPKAWRDGVLAQKASIKGR